MVSRKCRVPDYIRRGIVVATCVAVGFGFGCSKHRPPEGIMTAQPTTITRSEIDDAAFEIDAVMARVFTVLKKEKPMNGPSHIELDNPIISDLFDALEKWDGLIRPLNYNEKIFGLKGKTNEEKYDSLKRSLANGFWINIKGTRQKVEGVEYREFDVGTASRINMLVATVMDGIRSSEMEYYTVSTAGARMRVDVGTTGSKFGMTRPIIEVDGWEPTPVIVTVTGGRTTYMVNDWAGTVNWPYHIEASGNPEPIELPQAEYEPKRVKRTEVQRTYYELVKIGLEEDTPNSIKKEAADLIKLLIEAKKSRRHNPEEFEAAYAMAREFVELDKRQKQVTLALATITAKPETEATVMREAARWMRIIEENWGNGTSKSEMREIYKQADRFIADNNKGSN